MALKQEKGIFENRWLHVAILLVATLLVYGKVFHAGFMSWDDADYVLQNKDIRALNTEHIGRWFSEFYIGNYHPLTLVSYALDFLIGKQEPFVYHATNILLHTLSTVVLYNFIITLNKSRQVAFFAALLFAIHPVQTESVAWVAERKNVLYGFFFLLSIWAYAKYAVTNKMQWLLYVLVVGIAAMLSKATAVALPLSLFAVDIWMHRSLKEKNTLVVKLILLVLAIPVGIIAIKAQEQGTFLNLHAEYSWLQRIVFAGYAYTQYIVQVLLPVKLSVLYPYPKEIGIVHILYAIIALTLLFLIVVSYKKRWTVLCGGLLFYTVNIIFVLQFVQFGEVLMADRYLYIACIGILYPAVYYLFAWLEKKQQQVVPLIVATCLCIVLAGATYLRNNIWLSELNFWEAIVNTFPGSSIAQSSIGGVYLNMGQYDEAMQHINEAIRTDNANYKAWYNKGVVHLRKGQVAEALTALNTCIALNEYPKALFTRALVFQQAQQPLQALADIEKVLLQEPENARAWFIKGNCLEQQNSLPEAANCYTKAIEYSDAEPLFYMRRGIVRRGMGQGGCDDLQHAVQMGYKPAMQAAVQLCNN